MSLDLRHWVFCSLGPVDPRSPVTIQEDHVQGQGLCLTKATITLTGAYRPAAGSPISLAYSDGVNWIARVPRRLRVLSSQVDPLQNITTISAGCLLTYHSNRKPPVNVLKETEENIGVSEVERRSSIQLMSSAWVAGKILQTLGLTAAGGVPFNIKRIVDEWDMSGGYVEELGKIAKSDGYFAWINESEQVEFINKRSNPSGPGPLLTGGQILEMTPVNVGDLPGDAVFAKYTTTALRPPDANQSDDDIKRRNWEREVVFGDPVQAIHTYTDEAGQTVKEFITYNEYNLNETFYDERDRVTRRRDYSSTLNGGKITETTFIYSSGIGASEDISDVKEERTIEFGDKGDLLAACGANGPHAATFRQKGTITTGWRTTIYDKDKGSGITQTKTRNATQYLNTPHGSDAISRLRDAGETLDNLLFYAGRIVGYGSQTRIRTEREFGLQRRPSQQERNRSALEKAPSVEQVAAVAWAMGSPASQTAVELSPPYVSDDRITSAGSPPVYTVITSSAQAEALAYATGENRLLLGNRNGQGLQLHPMDLPAKPMDALYLRINGVTGAYRVNGCTWSMAADGIRCTTDALFWAAVDGDATKAFFPLPPGVTTLPAAAAVTTNPNPRPPNAMAIPAGFNPLAPNLSALFAALPSGLAPIPRATITPTRFVPPYNTILQARGGARVGARVRLQRWLPKTIQVAGGVRVGGMGRRVHMIGTGSNAIITTHPATLTQVGGFGNAAALILHFDGPGFVDSSANAYPVTASGDAVISTAQFKFGGAAAKFVKFAIDTFVSVTGAQLAVGVGNWAMQAWIRIDNTTTYGEHVIAKFGDDYQSALMVRHNTTGEWVVGWYDDSAYPEATSGPLAVETWIHVLVSKQAQIIRIFVAGDKTSSDYVITGPTSTANITATTIQVGGSDYDSALTFPGYIDDVVLEPGRVVDANFTPPTAPYPNP